MSFDWADMSYQERRAPGVAVVFALAIFLVFLMLAAQYESWGMPFSVLLGTPFAAFGAYLGLWLARMFMGESYVNNVFAQIGLIMLIGLAAKNAILIVEFAKVEHEQGKSLVDAALSAAKLRLRPILMTAFAFILGVVPLLTASGAGAEARKVMGMMVFSGMLIATILGVLLIPMLYVAVGKVIGEAKPAPAPAPAPAHARDRTRTGEPLRWLDCLALCRAALVADARVAARPGARRRPQLRAAAAAESAAVPLRRRRRHRRSRSPTRRGGRCSTIPALQALIREAHRQQPRPASWRSRASRRRAPAPASRSRSSTRRSTASPATACGRRRTRPQDGRRRRHDAPERRRTASSCRGRSICSAACGGSTKRRWRCCSRASRAAAACSSRWSATSRPTTSCCASSISQLEIARQTLRLNDETVTYFQNRLDGGVSNRLELDRIQAQPGADRRRDSGHRAADRHRRERAVAAARPPAGADRARARSADADAAAGDSAPACRPRCSSGGPTSCRRSSCSSRPTPTSAPPRRCSFRRSA